MKHFCKYYCLNVNVNVNSSSARSSRPELFCEKGVSQNSQKKTPVLDLHF